MMRLVDMRCVTTLKRLRVKLGLLDRLVNCLRFIIPISNLCKIFRKLIYHFSLKLFFALSKD